MTAASGHTRPFLDLDVPRRYGQTRQRRFLNRELLSLALEITRRTVPGDDLMPSPWHRGPSPYDFAHIYRARSCCVRIVWQMQRTVSL